MALIAIDAGVNDVNLYDRIDTVAEDVLALETYIAQVNEVRSDSIVEQLSPLVDPQRHLEQQRSTNSDHGWSHIN